MTNPTPPPQHPGQPAAPGPQRTGLVLIVVAAVVVVLAVAAVAGYLVLRRVAHLGDDESPAVAPRAVRVTSAQLITAPEGGAPTAVVALYEDFLCPACGKFEQQMGATVAKLIDTGAAAVDYYPVAILDSSGTDHYSSRAAAAAYCVADESIEAFRRFHTALFTAQPEEVGGDYPDDAQLIERARQAGVVGGVPDCITSGKYLAIAKGMAKATGTRGTPTVKINGEDYKWSTPEALVAEIEGIVGDVPGL